ncbi:MAG: hypothetical protein IJF84_13810 [Thermoguttaceae bacterium]|nr:hypothetical protein [Thermoguttaceae bacterium]
MKKTKIKRKKERQHGAENRNNRRLREENPKQKNFKKTLKKGKKRVAQTPTKS